MPTLPDPREVVARGYDQIAERYAAWVRDDVLDTVVPRYLGQLIELLPAGGTVLDLGVAVASGWRTLRATSPPPGLTFLSNRSSAHTAPFRMRGSCRAT
jgi:hypothetical protein